MTSSTFFYQPQYFFYRNCRTHSKHNNTPQVESSIPFRNYDKVYKISKEFQVNVDNQRRYYTK